MQNKILQHFNLSQLYDALESQMSELAIKPRLAVVLGTGDTEIRYGCNGIKNDKYVN